MTDIYSSEDVKKVEIQTVKDKLGTLKYMYKGLINKAKEGLGLRVEGRGG